MKKRPDPELPSSGGDGRVSAETAAELAELRDAFDRIERDRARAVRLLASIRSRGDGEAAVGMPIEQHLSWTTRQRMGTVNGFAQVVDVIDHLPRLRESLDAGDASFEQVKAVAYAVRSATRDERAGVDQALAGADWSSWDPDHVEFEVSRILAELRDPVVEEQRRERVRQTQWFKLQPTLDGQGLYGEFFYNGLDAALIDAVVHGAAGVPTADEHDGLGPTKRQRSLAQSLLEIIRFWQRWATGRDPAGDPDEPRHPAATIIVVKDEHSVDSGRAAEVWANTPRLRPTLTDTELATLDAKQVTVRLDDQLRPVSIDGRAGHATNDPDTLTWDSWKLLVTVRDGQCRTPGCTAPARWLDVHHLLHRAMGGPDRDDNLVAVCRRCHLRVLHRWAWTAKLTADGTATWLRAGGPITTTLPRLKRRLRSLPPKGPPS